MKKFLYIMPAILICMLYLLLAALAGGFSGFQSIAFIYIIFPVVSGILLRRGKWWGGLFGVAMGSVLIYNSMTTDTGMKAALMIGIVLAVYYAVMSLVCATDNKK